MTCVFHPDKSWPEKWALQAPSAKDMAKRIMSSVNVAVLKIRQALVSAGYEEALGFFRLSFLMVSTTMR